MKNDYIHPWYDECVVNKCVAPYSHLLWFYRKKDGVPVHTRFLIYDEHVEEIYEGVNY